MANHYCYRVEWSEEDKEYVGLCAEFPSLSWLSDSQEESLRGICDLVTETVKDMEENGERVPLAIADIKYSGDFMVRVPHQTHRYLAIQAAKKGISLNRLVSEKLVLCHLTDQI